MTPATAAAVALGALAVISMAATATMTDNLSRMQANAVGTDGIGPFWYSDPRILC